MWYDIVIGHSEGTNDSVLKQEILSELPRNERKDYDSLHTTAIFNKLHNF